MANQLFEKQCTQLSGEFCERLLKDISFGACGPVRLLAQSIWDAIHACSVGNEGVMFLWVAFDTRTRDSLIKAISHLDNDPKKPNIQTVWLPILEQRLAANRSMLAKMLSSCKRMIVWVNQVDISDGTFLHWLKIQKNLPLQIPITYLSSNRTLLELIHAKQPHQDFEIISIKTENNADFKKNNIKNTIFIEFNTIQDDFDFSEDMLTRCRKANTLVLCRDDWTRIKYSEWSHWKHIPVIQDIFSHPDHVIQTISRDISVLFQNTPISYRNLVCIDPEPYQNVQDMYPVPNTDNSHATLVATSHLSLLSILAGIQFPVPQCQNPEFIEIFHLFSDLFHGERLRRDQFDASCGDFGEQVLDHWISNGYVAGKDSFTITDTGRHLFTKVQDFSQLGILHSTHHKAMAETVNKNFSMDVDSDFLRLNISKYFASGGQPWECRSHHILKNTAILSPAPETVTTAWLDSQPVILPPHFCSRIESILFSDELPPDISLSHHAQETLLQLRQSFLDMKEHRCIETCQGIAYWWTFAGAEINHLVSLCLNILSPKLHVSYGNLHLRLAWARSSNNPAPEIERLKSLSDQIRNHKLPENSQRALFELWQQQHPYGWIFPLFPKNILKQKFTREMEYIQLCFPAKPLLVHEVSQLHQIDKSPLEFAKLIHPKMMEKTTDDITQVQTPNSPSPNRPTPVNVSKYHKQGSILQSEHCTQPRPGIMHTSFPWTYIDNEAALGQAINTMLNQKYIGLDVETTLYDQSLCLIQIGCENQVFMIDPLCVDFMGLSQVFANPNIIKIIHNSSFEKKVLGKYGLQILNIVDTLKWSRQLYGMKIPGGHSLKAVCMREFGYDMDKTNQQSRWEKRPLTDEQLEYAALDAEILIHLYRHFLKKGKMLI